MGRKANSDYIGAASKVLGSTSRESLRTREMYSEAVRRKLIRNTRWAYHAFSRFIRDSELFDTSKRGWVSLENRRTGKQTLDRWHH